MDDKKMMELMNVCNETRIVRVMESNSLTMRFGLTMTEEMARNLIEARNEKLHEEERVEFGETILPRIIYEFCDSPFIKQEDYEETLMRLQEMFYYYKNQCRDELTDDELLGFMKIHFDGDCRGSLDYLEETCLDMLARDIRSVVSDITDLSLSETLGTTAERE